MSRPPAKQYRPMASSVASRVLAYFDANPDEVLSTIDISVKFGVCSGSVSPCLRDAVKTGHLVRELAKPTGTRTHSMWSRNPRRDELLAQAAALNCVKVHALQGGGARIADHAGTVVRITQQDMHAVGRMLITMAEAHA